METNTLQNLWDTEKAIHVWNHLKYDGSVKNGIGKVLGNGIKKTGLLLEKTLETNVESKWIKT